MIKIQCRSLVALAAFALMLLGGGRSADADETKGVFCMRVTSELTGIVHTLTLNYTLNPIPFGITRGHALFYGASCYVIPVVGGSPADDCVAVNGSGLVFENKFEISLHGVENQQDFGKDILTISNIHVWIQNLSTLTGTWAGESSTYIEDGVQGLRQFDKGTAAAIACPVF